MKKILALILVFICLCNCSYTLTIEDNDYGYIDRSLIPKRVFLDWIKKSNLNEEATAVAILMDISPEEIETFIWEYSIDAEHWIEIPNEHSQTYTFILNENILNNYLRVRVILKEG